MTQTIQQRREGILAIAYQQSYVSVKYLAEQLNVSEATIRRDLQGLATQGHLELTHGGNGTFGSLLRKLPTKKGRP